MTDPFREAEASFGRLLERFKEQKITPQEFSDSLKRLRIKDDEGRFWVIGARSGKWYAYENGEWAEAKPPSQKEKKAICIACGFENDLEADFCARCGSRPGEGDPGAPEVAYDFGSGPRDEVPAGGVAAPDAAAAGGETVIRSFDIKSFFWFFGVLGLFAGLALGLLAGVTGLFADFVSRLPGFFVEHQGDLWGGLAFSLAGAVLGFVLGGAFGAAAAAASNGVLSLVGGLRFRRS
ncbi:MAG: zinc ribbon domain-containing protein [Acidobacteria bacterium]|nr:zinc ribbon domain-containing protein [Acidobacteriota bacterium]